MIKQEKLFPFFIVALITFSPFYIPQLIITAQASEENPCTYETPGWLLPQGEGIHVATSGADNATCGAISAPCRSIELGLSRATSGGTVWVHAGIYEENNLTIPSNVTLVSADGPQKAHIYSKDNRAVYFYNVNNASVDGFDIYGDWNAGSSGDGLVRVLDSTNIKIRNCLIHDAKHDSDCIKVSGKVDGLLMERLVIWNPGARETGTYQENIDLFGSDGTSDDGASLQNITLRGSWLFHTQERGGQQLIYAKASVENIIYEENIFGPSETMAGDGPSVNAGGNEPDPNNPSGFTGWHFIVRNNIFLGLRGDCALGISNIDDAWVYNNTFYANSGPNLRSVIMFRGQQHPLDKVNIFNNIFTSNYPERDGADFYWVREGGIPTTFVHMNNFYFNNIAQSDFDYRGEDGSQYDKDPLLGSPAPPSRSTLPTNIDAIETLLSNFFLTNNSPAVNQGVDAVSQTGHPNWDSVATRHCDISQNLRIEGATWDTGAHEIVDQNFIIMNIIIE